MKSTAHIKSHPIHPILIVFPIAFFTGTLLFDLLGQFVSEDFIMTAQYLEIAGIAGGLLAAVPGLIDYINTVPPNSSAKKRATLHMLVNVTMVGIFAVALYVRTNTTASPWAFIFIELTGVILMTIGGWLGGTLVYRNQIGVDVRYAHAGKWKQEKFDSENGKIRVAYADELRTNQMKLIIVGGKRIAIAKVDNGYVAFSDRCTHRGGPLTGGSMICSTVQCPWHGSQFLTTTGEVKAGPAKSNIQTFTLMEEGGSIWLLLNE
jgi:uncharacterized membrane protein/nitrite reductase/ring-hydroxylating ferredoxin subunit